MPQYIYTERFSNAGTRNEVRKRVIDRFAEEPPGQGTGANATTCIYYVETLSSGKRVFLTRPGWLNKQFDFVINVEGYNFANGDSIKRTSPAHGDIFADLLAKRNNEPQKYARLHSLIDKVYKCQEVDPSELTGLNFDEGMPADLILYVLKWFFIEQDVAYWNYSGRAKFMEGVPEPEQA